MTKVLTGAGAEKFGTGSFEVSLACTLRDEELEIADGATRTVSADAPTALYTALPTGAICRVAETDAGGATNSWLADAAGERLVVDDEGGYTFTVTTDPTDLVDVDQPQPPVSAVNEFLFASISATKQTRSAAGAAATGAPATFPISVVCTLLGLPVTAAKSSSQRVAPGETVVWTELPVGAECAVTETDAGGALSTTVAVDDAPAAPGRAATVVLAEGDDESPSVVSFVNTFADPMPPTGGSVPWGSVWLAGGMLVLGLVLVVARRRRRV